ncbi:MAG TPA: DUF2752 domain-containing protein [Edaphobacter sp.]|jgi:hypothetical protein|nr:DUF2752 domain-containing protein [Edaphobacter sp.]
MSDGRNRTGWMLRISGPPAAIAFAVSILLLFPPAKYGFYPQCPFREIFHLLCPGCGATRALAALLHGQLSEALRLNMLTVLLMPFAGVYGAVCYYRIVVRQPLSWPQLPPAGVYTTLAVVTIFVVIRNLPHSLF